MKINAVVNPFLSQRVVFAVGNMTIYGSGADKLGGGVILPATLAKNSVKEKVRQRRRISYQALHKHQTSA